MIRIKELNEESLWDLVSFCYRHPEKEGAYTAGDVERFQEGHQRKAEYLKKMLPEGVQAQIAYEKGKGEGFIEYYPIEVTNLEIDGKDIMAIWCIDVREEMRERKMGSMLIKTCLMDVRQLRRKGAAVTCWDPFWMPKRIFLKHGFVDVGPARQGGRVLLRSFEPVYEPCWIEREPEYYPQKDKLVLDLYYPVRCPIHWRKAQLIKDIVAEYEPLIEIREHRTDDRADMCHHGMAWRSYLNGRLIAAGLLADKQEIRNVIKEETNSMKGRCL